jgi:hypothetical protein
LTYSQSGGTLTFQLLPHLRQELKQEVAWLQARAERTVATLQSDGTNSKTPMSPAVFHDRMNAPDGLRHSTFKPTAISFLIFSISGNKTDTTFLISIRRGVLDLGQRAKMCSDCYAYFTIYNETNERIKFQSAWKQWGKSYWCGTFPPEAMTSRHALQSIP